MNTPALESLKTALKDLPRLSWEEYFAAITILISNRSPSERLKVGCVIVRDKRVISSGYNGYPAGTPHESIMRDGHEINTIHAEQNAIADAARRGTSIEGAKMFVSHFPCIHCTKFAISSGVKEIYYLDDYRNDDIVELLCKNSSVSLCKLGVSGSS